MKQDLILAQLFSVRATIEALIAEVSEGEKPKAPAQCCEKPSPVANETYSGRVVHCANCGEQIAPRAGLTTEEVRSNGSRQSE